MTGVQTCALPISEIVISPDAHPNVNGLPFASQVFLTHSSDLRTMQKIFHATRPIFVGDAVHADDLSSLFARGVIPDDGDDDDHGNDHANGYGNGHN